MPDHDIQIFNYEQEISRIAQRALENPEHATENEIQALAIDALIAPGGKGGKYQGQRPGQAVYNYAHELLPEFADSVSGTEIDPFGNDSRIGAFLSALKDAL